MFADVLCVTVVQAQDGWGVTYTATNICAIKGSTVNIRCTYTYPSNLRVQETFWHTQQTNTDPVDLKTQSEYSGRVQYQCEDKTCALTIRDLRETDSAEYKFRVITNEPTGKYSGSPGVTLSVRVNQFPTWIELTCHSSCQLPDHTSYVWYRNEQKAEGEKRYFHLQTVDPADRYYCAIKGPEGFPSSPVYAPKLLSVSVSPSAEIVEGSSLTLTCSSDANPAANYTWYKENQTLLSKEPQLIFSSIQSSDSGEYYCTAENDLGTSTKNMLIDTPQSFLSVSVSPSAEIVEGSSVTLTCSSDANPAANYTWYKENEESPKASGQTFTITDIRPEHSGKYYCEAQNTRGRHNTTSQLTVVAGCLYLQIHSCYFSCYFALYMEPTQLRV
uniref:Sialic acid-binding Ig-like lectin 10 n=1 Tax=Mastacembelus armatus TaxID=205130 RepID=A0A3Q3L190_9TELE